MGAAINSRQSCELRAQNFHSFFLLSRSENQESSAHTFNYALKMFDSLLFTQALPWVWEFALHSKQRGEQMWLWEKTDVNKYLACFSPSCRAAIVVNLACVPVSRHEVTDGVFHTDGTLGNSNSRVRPHKRRPNAFINSQMAATESFAKVCVCAWYVP